MDIWGNYKSKLGYLAGDSKIDTYGVDHSKFSLRDEIAYQMARSEREGQLIKNLNSQGINKDYPQYGTNFWGGNAENNYGFGSSDISENIENVTNSLKNTGFGFDQNTGTIAIVPQQKQTLAQPNTTAIGQNNALGQQEHLSITSNNSHPTCYMTFDGQNLNLYYNGDLIESLDAQSGRDEYQSAQYQNIANKGPLPVGTYYANQNQRQNITAKDAIIGTIAKVLGISKGKWSGGPISWGTKRVWLQPDENTNTYGRSGFTIHGGLTKGSAGCIDIPWQTNKLSDYLDNCQESVPVEVEYPKNW